MERIHQHDVRLRKDLRAHCRQQAAALREPVGHPIADRIIAVGVADPLGNRIDLGPAEHVVTGASAVPPGRYRRATSTASPASEAKLTTGTPGGE